MNISKHEEAQLDEFSCLMREAHPDPSVSNSFNDGLSKSISNGFQIKRSFEQSPFMRVAAALLIICIVGVPAAAFMGVLPFADKKATIISYVPSTEFSALNIDEQTAEPELAIVPPADEYLNDTTYHRRVKVLSAHNYWQRLLAPLPDSISDPVLVVIDGVFARIAVSQ
ncbi:MAG: hypothetical protein H8E25_09170 [Planctomycetes bacterium]|nr:hypothetical protein [Planctomycetota bacterium]